MIKNWKTRPKKKIISDIIQEEVQNNATTKKKKNKQFSLTNALGFWEFKRTQCSKEEFSASNWIWDKERD